MSVDHRGRDVSVAEEFLEGTDVIAALEQVGGEGMGRLWQVACFSMPAARTAEANSLWAVVPPGARRLQLALNLDRPLPPREGPRQRPGFELRRPDDTVVAVGDPGVTFTAGATDAVYTIAAPTPGPSRVSLANRMDTEVEALLAVSAAVPAPIVSVWCPRVVAKGPPAATLLAAAPGADGLLRGTTIGATATSTRVAIPMVTGWTTPARRT